MRAYYLLTIKITTNNTNCESIIFNERFKSLEDALDKYLRYVEKYDLTFATGKGPLATASLTKIEDIVGDFIPQ